MECYTTFAKCSPDGGWIVGFHAFPDLFVGGPSHEAANGVALAALIAHVTILMSLGFPIPEPVEAIHGVDSIVLPSILARRIALHNESATLRT